MRVVTRKGQCCGSNYPHDLAHDVAQSIMIDECKLTEPNKVLEVSKLIRHMSIQKNSQQSFSQSNNLFKGQSLRSFLFLGYHGFDNQGRSYLSGQKHLRVRSCW